MDNLSGIVHLVSKLSMNGLEGRIRLQKLIYILQSIGLPFTEKYTYLHFGPFSHDLQYEINELKRYEILREEGGPPIGPYSYSLGKNAKAFMEQNILSPADEKLMKEALCILEGYKTPVLELLSTYWYLRKKRYAQPWRAVQELKGDRARQSYIVKAKELDNLLESQFSVA